jgi:hypothetical protein
MIKSPLEKFVQEVVFNRVLLELRNLPVVGVIPRDPAYFVELLSDGNVLYKKVAADGAPIARGDDPLDPTVLIWTRGWLVDIEKNPKMLAAVNKMIDAGLLKVIDEKLSDYDADPTAQYSFAGKHPSLFSDPKNLPKTAKKVVPTVGGGVGSKTLKVDTQKGIIDLSVNWSGVNTRRPGNSRSGKSYVIPSGDVAFDERMVDVQKVAKHLLQSDPRVTPDFKIAGSEKFRGMTIADLLEKPREVDAALTGQKPIVMFHGTSARRWKKIQKTGLRPGFTGETYVDLVPGYSDKNVYLTFSHATAENYATRQAIKDGGTAMVLKVTVPDYTRLLPDEDVMGEIQLSKPYSATTHGLKFKQKKEFTSIHPRTYHDWIADGKVEFSDPADLEKEMMAGIAAQIKRSLRSGTAAYRGVIPPKYIAPSMEYKKQAFRTPESRGGPGDFEYEDIRGEVQAAAKRFDESALRKFVRSVLCEDFEGFQNRVSDLTSFDTISGNFPEIEDWEDAQKQKVVSGKQIKRAFAQEADHDFMNSLTKVHWTGHPYSALTFLERASHRDETSTTAYLPGEPVSPEKGLHGKGRRGRSAPGGQVGIELQGRVTLAHADQNELYTGSWHSTGAGDSIKFSGVVRRPSRFKAFKKQRGWVLDRKSYDAFITPDEVNEFVVDNWKPVAVRVPALALKKLQTSLEETGGLAQEFKAYKKLFSFLKEAGIPVLDENGRDLTEQFLAIVNAK